MNANTPPTASVYIHIPFCKKRCGYCDFATTAGKESLIPRYVTHLCYEIKQTVATLPEKPIIETIFFGGGTPTLLSPTQYELILNTIHQSFDTSQVKEITTEANPGAIDLSKLKTLLKLGINRISFGAQAADQTNLQLLERIHSHADTIQAVKWAREAGFQSLNLDLIYGIPHQTIEQWQFTLNEILSLTPDHLSLYALTIEENTPLHHQVHQGKLPFPNDDLTTDMYEYAEQTLRDNGYTHYEISNWAKPEHQCIHNLLNWRHKPYYGFGVGAHSFTGKMRYFNPRSLTQYLQKTNPTETFTYPILLDQAELLPQQEQMGEMVFLGLRLLQEGISNQAFYNKFFYDLTEIYPTQIEQLIKKELLTWQGDALILTPKGRFLSNQVFMEFI